VNGVPSVALAVSELVIEAVVSTGNVIAFDVPPHGLTMVIEAEPGLAMRVTDTVAVSSVEETNVVGSALPFQFTIEVETKFVPFTVKVNCVSPALAQVGLSEVMIGVALMVKITAPDVPPHPLTVIEAVPGVIMRSVVTMAVSCFLDTNVVVSGVSFQYTVSPWMKLPGLGLFTVSVNCAPPAPVQVGLIVLIVGELHGVGVGVGVGVKVALGVGVGVKVAVGVGVKVAVAVGVGV